MIRNLSYLLFSIFVFVLILPIKAQDEISLDYFEASQNEDEVLLKWAIS